MSECICTEDCFEMIEDNGDDFSMGEVVAGPGVAPGGTTGQYLRKKSSVNYDTEWADLDAFYYVLECNATQIAYNPNSQDGHTVAPASVTLNVYKFFPDGRKTAANAYSLTTDLSWSKDGDTTDSFQDTLVSFSGTSTWTFYIPTDVIDINGLGTAKFTVQDEDNIPMASITIPIIPNVAKIDDTLTQAGEAADAKATGDALNTKAPVITDSASGAIASFPDGADGMPMKSLVCEINPVQDLHGYDYPWPAGGGKNLADPAKLKVESVNTTGNTTSVGDTAYRTQFFDALSAGTYTLKTYEISNIRYLRYAYEINEETSVVGLSSDSNPLTITLSNDVTNFRIAFRKQDSSSITETVYCQLESGSSATDFAPYSNICPISGHTGCEVYVEDEYDAEADPTVEIAFPSGTTVYGGTLDVTTGVLTLDKIGVIYNGSEEGWARNGNNGYYINAPANNYSNDAPLSNYLIGMVPGKGGSLSTWACRLNEAKAKLLVKPDTSVYDTVEKWQTYLSENPLTVVFGLATVITYQLETHQVATLLGTNNVWHDANGDTEVEYCADTKLFIEKLTQPTEDDMIANSNIASGVYFMVGNNLYLSTAAILAGDPIKPGTNCTLTNLAAALNAINS